MELSGQSIEEILKTTTAPDVSFKLCGFADEELAKKLAHTTLLWVKVVGTKLNLAGLDGITIAFDYAMAPMTRAERVEAHKGDIFKRYDGKLQAFLDFVLAQYVSQGVEELDPAKLPSLLELKYSTMHDAFVQLGEPGAIGETFSGFQKYLYGSSEA
jgi:hypothetical protein